MRHNFSIEFGGLKIKQSHPINRDSYVAADLHWLTPEQFDALMEHFDGEAERFLTTDSGKDFRSGVINLGGLHTSIYADVTSLEMHQHPEG